VNGQLHTSRIFSTRLEVAATTPLGSAAPDVRAKSIAFLMQCWKRKWIWALLVVVLSFESFFVRELLAGLCFFTIVYVFLAALAAIYLLIGHVLYCGALWAASRGRSFYVLLHHHVPRPSGVPSLSKSRALDSGQELGRA
jgi:hypothetical protein